MVLGKNKKQKNTHTHTGHKNLGSGPGQEFFSTHQWSSLKPMTDFNVAFMLILAIG